MTNYADGRRFEYKVRDALADDGYYLIRSAGSKGLIDVVAFKPGQMLFVQAKRRDGTIGPGSRAALLDLAAMVDALPIVAHQPIPRKPIRYRLLTGPGAKQWEPWTSDQVGAP